MNNQETFDTVAAHLLKQRRRAVIDGGKADTGVCLYRTADGLRCAVGCLIPDDQYRPELEHQSIVFVRQNVPALQQHDSNLLRELQQVHDYHHPREWEQALSTVAHNYDLVFNRPSDRQ